MRACTLLIPLLLIACRKNSPSPTIITPPDTAATVAVVPLNIPFVPYYDSFYGKLTLTQGPFDGSGDTMVTLCVRHSLPGILQFMSIQNYTGKIQIQGFIGNYPVNDSNRYGYSIAGDYSYYTITKDSLFYDAFDKHGADYDIFHYAGKRTSKLPGRDP